MEKVVPYPNNEKREQAWGKIKHKYIQFRMKFKVVSIA